MPQTQADTILAAVEDHYRMVYRLAYRILSNTADAEDVTQTVFLKLVRARQLGREILSVRAWLATAAVHTARNVRRDQSNRRRREERVGRTRREAPMQKTDWNDREAVERAIERLPDTLRIPLVLHYHEGLSYEEVARTLDCPAGTVASRISRARERLRRELRAVTAVGGLAPAAGLEALDAALSTRPPVPFPRGLRGRIENAVRETIATPAPAPTALHASAAASLGWTGWTGKTMIATVLASVLSLGSLGLLCRGLEETEIVSARPTTPATPMTTRKVAAPFLPTLPDEAARESASPVDDRTTAAQPLEAIVRGRAVDDEGRPVIGARVTVEGGRLSESRTATTGDDGHYRVSLPLLPETREEATMHASLEAEQALEDAAVSYVRVTELASASESQALGDFAATTTGHQTYFAVNSLKASPGETDRPLHGVVDASSSAREEPQGYVDWTGGPRWIDLGPSNVGAASFTEAGLAHQWIARRELSALDVESAAIQLRQNYLAQLTGQVTPEPPVSTVQISTPGFQPAPTVQIAIEPGAEHVVDFDLLRARPLQGEVVTASGQPMGGIEVHVVARATSGIPLDTLLLSDASRVTTTDDAGAFIFDSLPPGAYVLRATAEGYLPGEAVARPGRTTRIELLPAASLVVSVWHARRALPIQGAAILIQGPAGQAPGQSTGPAGEAEFTGLPPGEYSVSVHRRELPLKTRRVVLDSGERTVVEFEVTEGHRIHGRIQLSRQEPENDAKYQARAILLTPAGPRDSRVASVDADRQFHLDGLPAGTYSVVVGPANAEGARACLFETEMTLVGPGAGHDVDLFEPAGESAQLEVRLRGRGTEVHTPAVELTLERIPSRTCYYKGNIPADGKVRVPAGLYRLRLAADGCRTTELQALQLSSGESRTLELAVDPANRPDRFPLDEVLPAKEHTELLAPLSAAALLDLLDTVEPGLFAWPYRVSAGENLAFLDVDPAKGLAESVRKALSRSGLSWKVLWGRIYLEVAHAAQSP